jgi:hypothetical protein
MTAFSAPQERMQNYGTKPSEPLFSTKVTLSQVARPRFGHRQRGSRILPAESRLAGRLGCAAGRATDLHRFKERVVRFRTICRSRKAGLGIMPAWHPILNRQRSRRRLAHTLRFRSVWLSRILNWTLSASPFRDLCGFRGEVLFWRPGWERRKTKQDYRTKPGCILKREGCTGRIPTRQNLKYDERSRQL